MNVILDFILNIWFIWIPFILGIAFFKVLKIHLESKFIENKINSKYKMLEIKIPRNVDKSPEAMEMVIDILWHLGGGALMSHSVLHRSVLIPSSLEIVSIEGSIYFFIRTHIQLADLVKSTIYSQYPNAEVNEVDDYTRYVPDFTKNEDTWDLYGAAFKLAKEDFIPIKTYIDYGLDKTIGSLDEEQRIDPISPFLEFLGTLKKGQQIWVQFIVRADFFNKWRGNAKEYIKEIMDRGKEVADDEPFQTVKLTHGEQEMIKSIERSLEKHAFEVVIRGLYLAPKEHFEKVPIGFFKNNIFKPYSSNYFNAIWRDWDSTLVDWKYQEPLGLRTSAYKRRFFNDYLERSAFYEPFWKYINFHWYKRKNPMVLTSEELATLFHIPGRVATTSGIDRIDATKSEPPFNLPT